MKGIFGDVLELIFPADKECPLCGNPYEGDHCKRCLKEIGEQRYQSCTLCGRFLKKALGAEEELCSHCRQQRPPFSLARSVGAYDGLLKEAIYLLKYTGKQSLAGLLARLMIELVVREDVFLSVDLVVPVPVCELKLRKRTFNQAELLAMHLGKELGLPVESTSLIRNRNTPNLSKLPARERELVLRGAFQVGKGNGFAGKRVLLVDDIFTTGSTAGECTKALKEAGAKEVYVATLAAGIL